MRRLHRFYGYPLRPLFAAAGLALLGVCGMDSARADPAPYGDELKLAIILTRHGVRSPLLSNQALAPLASQPWPKWEVAPGIQTAHGNQLIALMGDYYRARFQEEGLLSGNPATDSPLIFIRADNDQRTLETARILGKALVAVNEPEVHSLPVGTVDPLFRPYKAHVGHADPELGAAAVLGRLGGDPRNAERAYATQLGELREILYGPAAKDAPAFPPASVKAGDKSYLVDIQGPMLVALNTTDSLLLEYAEGMPLAEVGWGRVNGTVMTDLLALHEFFFDVADRTFYIAQVYGSNLASHIVDTMEQAAGGDPVPGALGPPGEHILILAGHDSNIANIGGLFDMNWWVDGTQMDPVLPGGALIFELWKHGGPQGSFYVRTSYVAQTLDQMREATSLSLDHPPGLSPIFIPGCGGVGPNFDAPLASFIRQARKVISPAFIAPDE